MLIERFGVLRKIIDLLQLQNKEVPEKVHQILEDPLVLILHQIEVHHIVEAPRVIAVVVDRYDRLRLDRLQNHLRQEQVPEEINKFNIYNYITS